MSKDYDGDKDILKILEQATADAKALRNDAESGISKKVMENAMQMYQSGDTGGLKTMAENLCKERGITVDEAKQKVMSMFNH